MKYEAVIFDLYGTLIGNMPGYNSWLKEMASIIGVPADSFISEWHDAYDRRMTGKLKYFRDCLNYVCSRLNVVVDEDKMKQASDFRASKTNNEMGILQNNAIEVISRLKAKGLKLGLISNCSTEATIRWKTTPFAPLFDAPVFSCSVGLMKPDPHIFQLAAQLLNVQPPSCIFVADGMDGELRSAHNSGMHAVKIRFSESDQHDPHLEEWHGPTISSLSEVLNLVE